MSKLIKLFSMLFSKRAEAVVVPLLSGSVGATAVYLGLSGFVRGTVDGINTQQVVTTNVLQGTSDVDQDIYVLDEFTRDPRLSVKEEN